MRSKLVAALILTVVCGCSGVPDNGLLGNDSPAAAPAEGPMESVVDGGAPGEPIPGMPGPGPGPASTMDSGAVGAPHDAGANDSTAPPPSPPPPSAFDGAGAFVSVTAATTHHAGENCMNGCHNHGFTWAGTLTNGAGGGVAGAEVRLLDANGTAILVNTDSLGNFHSSTAFTGASHVGARTATKTVIMTATITSGACNACHVGGGTTTPIHVP
jgi:hypothetical protein